MSSPLPTLELEGGGVSSIFSELADETARSIARKGMKEAANIVLQEVIKRTPRDSGDLVNSQTVKIVTERAIDLVQAWVGPDFTAGGNHHNFVHGGHVDGAGRYVQGDPYIAQAVEATRATVLATLDEAVGAAVRKKIRS